MCSRAFEGPICLHTVCRQPMQGHGHGLMQVDSHGQSTASSAKQPGRFWWWIYSRGPPIRLKRAWATLHRKAGGKGRTHLRTAGAIAVIARKTRHRLGLLHGFDWRLDQRHPPEAPAAPSTQARSTILFQREERQGEALAAGVAELPAPRPCSASDEAAEIRERVRYSFRRCSCPLQGKPAHQPNSPRADRRPPSASW